MWRYQNTDELYHYGIPGMRWGIRRQRRLSEKANRLLSKNHGDQRKTMRSIDRKAGLKKART